jgi:hypothetical protein
MKTKEIDKEEDMGSILDVLGLEQEAKNSLSPKDLDMMKRIAFQIKQQGMLPEEACEIENVSYSFLKELAGKFPIINKIIRVSELKYKRMLMDQVSRSARSGDGKMALWLLERRYTEEFGTASAKKKSGDPERDLLGAALNYIQESSDIQPLVRSIQKVPATVVNNPTKKAKEQLQAYNLP